MGVVALLGLRPSLPLSPLVQATRMISASPRAEKRFIRAMRVWISAAWRSGSREAMRSPKLLRRRIWASIRLQAWYPVSRFQNARPKCLLARKVSFLARAPGLSSFQGRPFLRIGMTAVPPRSAMTV